MEKNNFRLNVSLDDERWKTELPDIGQLSEQVAQSVWNYVSAHEDIDFMSFGKPVEVNVSLNNDAEVHRLNKEFRNMDKPTNVLSFANIDDENFEDDIRTNPLIELGDIIIALETMQREAEEKNISLHDHYCHLFTHGLLHLLGFDHVEDDEAEYMESFETEILSTLNIADPYQE